VEEEEARLALLQTELNTIQSSIRGLDSIIFQIKGWCVTTSLAIGGFAVAYHKPALLFIGGAATVGFFMINCQFKMFQRVFLNRNLAINAELQNTGIMEVLKGAGSFDIVGTALEASALKRVMPFRERIRSGFPRFLVEVHAVNTFSLYLFISLCLTVEAIVLLL
jgi:hypothetical protein